MNNTASYLRTRMNFDTIDFLAFEQTREVFTLSVMNNNDLVNTFIKLGPFRVN